MNTEVETPEKPVELNKIKRSMHKDVIHSFWLMMTTIETQANNEKDAVLMHWVECWYKQWNRMTGDNKSPQWTP